jgi:hypothetical protein
MDCAEVDLRVRVHKVIVIQIVLLVMILTGAWQL